ncbi:MAG: type II toxin-antitoxin system Phd/YefM family antitoxin [Candidatus Tumulicola sp.]
MTTNKKGSKKSENPVSLLMLRSREVGAAEFKARCLEIMDEVERLGAEIVITKHRRPVARLLPISDAEAFCGSLSGVIVKAGDLISPTGVEWEADEPNFA